MGIGHRQSYSPEVRNFCIALKNINLATYRFLREEFDNHIPHCLTITAWHVNSDINCDPGIMKHSMDILRRKAAVKREKGETLLGAVLFDEMSIRKHLQWVNDKLLGFEQIPGKTNLQSDVASEALVFMFSALNDNIRLPIAYYFTTKKIDVTDKMCILKDNLQAIFDCGAKVICITFDGLRMNPHMCELLGAILNVDEFGSFFYFGENKFRIIFDFSHVEKLIRNNLSNKKVIYDENNNKIEWKYFEQLVNFKDKRNFAFSPNLTQAHIKWQSNPMNVKLAVQTFSASTANAMEFLKNQGHPQFAKVEPTVNLVRIVNDLFDVSNSTDSTKANPLKNPMSEKNIDDILRLFQHANKYIRGLQVMENGKKVKLCSTQVKTGFQGLLVNIQSLTEIYKEIVIEKKLMKSISTHSMSQDHLEVFFGKVRSLNGFNNNPRIQQFIAAMRKMLANTTLVYSKHGNCSVLNTDSVYNPYSNISYITSRRSTENNIMDDDVHGDGIENLYTQLADIQHLYRVNILIDLGYMTVAQIAGMIEWRIFNSNRFSCEDRKTV